MPCPTIVCMLDGSEALLCPLPSSLSEYLPYLLAGHLFSSWPPNQSIAHASSHSFHPTTHGHANLASRVHCVWSCTEVCAPENPLCLLSSDQLAQTLGPCSDITLVTTRHHSIRALRFSPLWLVSSGQHLQSQGVLRTAGVEKWRKRQNREQSRKADDWPPGSSRTGCRAA
ncbi:hypothetical protein N658DRAFT_214329 [Parathielavia hyrcaniae]|uniref:Uncharacterized protein n=1 Tax=Parathielavia hyrcaniae TaxID=113614 RepID=A0AAN6SZP4_9PEZI|nr:hypothetical protein N658DRAFT_214329 [Parathielavia hyrcaniae]